MQKFDDPNFKHWRETYCRYCPELALQEADEILYGIQLKVEWVILKAECDEIARDFQYLFVEFW